MPNTTSPIHIQVLSTFRQRKECNETKDCFIMHRLPFKFLNVDAQKLSPVLPSLYNYNKSDRKTLCLPDIRRYQLSYTLNPTDTSVRSQVVTLNNVIHRYVYWKPSNYQRTPTKKWNVHVTWQEDQRNIRIRKEGTVNNYCVHSVQTVRWNTVCELRDYWNTLYIERGILKGTRK
jgi:hypothetical protein